MNGMTPQCLPRFGMTSERETGSSPQEIPRDPVPEQRGRSLPAVHTMRHSDANLYESTMDILRNQSECVSVSPQFSLHPREGLGPRGVL